MECQAKISRVVCFSKQTVRLHIIAPKYIMIKNVTVRINPSKTWLELLNGKLNLQIKAGDGYFVHSTKYTPNNPKRGSGIRAEVSDKISSYISKYRRRCEKFRVHISKVTGYQRELTGRGECASPPKPAIKRNMSTAGTQHQVKASAVSRTRVSHYNLRSSTLTVFPLSNTTTAGDITDKTTDQIHKKVMLWLDGCVGNYIPTNHSSGRGVESARSYLKPPLSVASPLEISLNGMDRLDERLPNGRNEFVHVEESPNVVNFRSFSESNSVRTGTNSENGLKEMGMEWMDHLEDERPSSITINHYQTLLSQTLGIKNLKLFAVKRLASAFDDDYIFEINKEIAEIRNNGHWNEVVKEAPLTCSVLLEVFKTL